VLALPAYRALWVGGYFSQQKSDPLHNPDCCCYFFTCDIRASLKTTEFAVVPIENQ
jgi:hypothetical protein